MSKRCQIDVKKTIGASQIPLSGFFGRFLEVGDEGSDCEAIIVHFLNDRARFGSGSAHAAIS